MIDNSNAKYSMQVLGTDTDDATSNFSTSYINQAKMAEGTLAVAQKLDTTVRALMYLSTNSYRDTMITGKGSLESQLAMG